MSMEQNAPAPAANAPKPQAPVVRWIDAEPIETSKRSLAGNLKSIRRAVVLGTDGCEHTITVIGVASQWANCSNDAVEVFRAKDLNGRDTVSESPIPHLPPPVDPGAFSL